LYIAVSAFRDQAFNSGGPSILVPAQANRDSGFKKSGALPKATRQKSMWFLGNPADTATPTAKPRKEGRIIRVK
jgi:hypothetical protein